MEAASAANALRLGTRAYRLLLPARLPGAWTAAIRRLQAVGFVARFTLLGAVGGVLIASAALWWMETRVAEVLLRQAAARATDHVRLAVLSQVTTDDFVPPHTPVKLAALSARLAPSLGGVQHDGSGILGVNLVAPDGTVLYSDLTRKRGQNVGPSDLPLLSQALTGVVASELDAFSDEQDADLRRHYDSALEVYVPVVLGGHVVGAYEIYQDLAPVRSARPFVWGTIAVVFGTLFHLGIRSAASARSDHAPRPLRVGRTGAQAEAPRVRLCAGGDRGLTLLTPRELEVLRLMATSHTYHEMAVRLAVSEETVRSHVKRILHKLGQPDRTQAVVAALRLGVLQLS